MIEIEKVQKANKQEGLKTLWSFECPSCSAIVHRPLTDGRKSNSCGSADCKLTIATLNNPRITSKPFYSAIAMQYSYLKEKYVLSKDWDTLSKYYSSVYKEYSDIRKTSSKVHITVEGSIASPLTTTLSGKEGDYRLLDDGIVGIDCTEKLPKGHYTTTQVAKKVNTTHENVRRRLTRLQKTSGFSSTAKCTVASTGERSRKIVAELLTTSQYKELVTSMQATAIRNHPNNIYLIQGNGLTKIGISSNVDSRYKKLCTSSPIDLKLLSTCKVINARKIEKELHTKYKEYNSHGEWFNLTDTQVKEIITYLDSLK